jgi:hypothetical protein
MKPLTAYGREVTPNETSRLLTDSIKIAKNTDNISNDTIIEMVNQKNTLQDSSERLSIINNISKSARLNFKRIRDYRNRKKLILWLIIILLGILNLYLLYIMFENGGKLYKRYYH